MNIIRLKKKLFDLKKLKKQIDVEKAIDDILQSEFTVDVSNPRDEMFDLFKDQVLLILIKKLGGVFAIPVAEIDATEGLKLTMEYQNNSFVFKLNGN